MKLRNKKTGEIVDADFNATISGRTNIIIIQKGPEQLEYGSLAELNEEWEDYEEKTAWFIDSQGDIQEWRDAECDDWTNEKAIGNYFETKEEAEQAVEKLKAWKRLKENNIHLIYDEENFESGLPTISIRFGSTYNQHEEIMNEKIKKDLDLLFGGEE